MRTKMNMRHLLIAASLGIALQGYSQADVTNHNGGTNFYLGWNATANQILDVKNEGNQPIDFYTSDRFRARINPRMTYPSLNSFTNIPADGFTLITPDNGFLGQAPRGPFSRLHLAERGTTGNAEQWGYRPWQRNGITFTGNTDQGYMGQKYRDGDDGSTDMVIQWSDNPGQWKGDRMRFLFTSSYNSTATTGMNSREGLEGMRLYPDERDFINVGIGDFFAGGDDPTERLDVRTGRVRIRQLPTDAEANTLDKYMVVDNTGVVWWRHLPVVPPPTTCDWTLNPAMQNNVSTAYGPVTPNCPDETDAVGIGVNLLGTMAPAKLNLATNKFAMAQSVEATMATGTLTGMKVRTNGGASREVGLSILSEGTGGSLEKIGADVHVEVNTALRTRGVMCFTNGAYYTSYAGFFASNDNALWATGAQGLSRHGSLSSTGLSGRSYGSAGINAGVSAYHGVDSASIYVPSGNYGLLAATSGHVQGTDWAGWFQGDVNVSGMGVIPGGVWTSSDENLKENIDSLENATAVLQQLMPKSYTYRTEQYPQLGLPGGPQFGFMAQELQQAIPAAVKPLTVHAVLDSVGNVLHPELQTMVVNQTTIIPFLVAGFKEQQQQIATLQAQLAACCAANPGIAPGGNGALKAAPATGEVKEQHLLIIPNPVADLTTLEYYVPQAGKVSLSISTSDGKPMGTLREEQAEVGAYTYQWNTTKLAVGTYFCTYLLDGTVVVKRAVKVQ